MRVTGICTMKPDGACPDVVTEEGGWPVKATFGPEYLAGKCEDSIE